MSDFLGNCLRNAIIVAFGVAMIDFIFIILTVAILGAIATGGAGAGPAVIAILPVALAAAGIFFAAVFITNVVACIIQDNSRAADVQAGRPGGGGQALEEKEKPSRCVLCGLLPGLVIVSSALGFLTGFIITRH